MVDAVGADEPVRRRVRRSTEAETVECSEDRHPACSTPREQAPGQLVIPIAAPDDGPGRLDGRDCRSRPRALVLAGPRRSATAVSPGQDRRGDPKAFDFGESSGAVRIRKRPKARARGDGSPATPWLHLRFCEVNVVARDLDRVDDLGQKEKVGSQRPDQPVVPWRPLAFEVPRCVPHVRSLAYGHEPVVGKGRGCMRVYGFNGFSHVGVAVSRPSVGGCD